MRASKASVAQTGKQFFRRVALWIFLDDFLYLMVYFALVAFHDEGLFLLLRSGDSVGG